MAYSKIVAQLVADNAHADGYFNTSPGGTGRFGIGRDWEAQEPREEEGGSTPDVGGQYGWAYNGQFEYLDRIGGIAPLGTATQADMSLSAWDLTGLWRLSSKSANLRTRYLHFYDGAVGAGGHAVSKATFAPNLQFWLWRMGGAATETEPPLLVVKLLGDGASASYAIALPAYREQGSYADGETQTTGRQSLQPQLWGKAPGETAWTVIDNLGAGSAPTLSSAGNQPDFQTLRIEFVEDALLIRMSERGDAWVFSGEWDSVEGAHIDTVNLGTGKVRVDVAAHTAQFVMAPLVYPTSASIEPHKWFHALPTRMWAQDPVYRVIGTTPAGTALTTAIVEKSAGAPEDMHPRVTFTSTDTNKRAVLYNVQEYRTPTITAGTSAPGRTQGNTGFVLKSCSGNINDSWRGSSMTAEVEAPNATLNDLRPNTWLSAMVNVSDGAADARYNYTDGVTGYQYTQLFTGYATPPEKGIEGADPFRVLGRLQAADIMEARLRNHKLYWQCSFEGWPLISAFTYLLNCAGVPSSKLSVDARVTAYNPIIPFGTSKCARRFSFSPDTDVVSALDTLVGACGVPSVVYPNTNPPTMSGLTWGVNVAGVIRLAPCYEHRPNYYYLGSTARTAASSDGWTLSDTPAADEDMALNIRSHRAPADFANFLVIMTGQGVEAAAKVLYDEGSWSTPPTPGDPTSATRFIADVWARFETFPDGADIEAIAQEIQRQVRYWEWAIEWDMDDCPWILPDDEVRMQVTDLNVPTNSIYRVVNKSWSCAEGGRYSQTLLAHMVQETV